VGASQRPRAANWARASLTLPSDRLRPTAWKSSNSSDLAAESAVFSDSPEAMA
jgi:hypothetical protein